MQEVPESVWTIWRQKKETGDVKALVEKTGYSEPTIRQALNQRLAQLEVQQAITSYFVEKEHNKKVAAAKAEAEQLERLNNI